MTVDFDIKSVAIIGAGASGLAAAFELLHTSKKGLSTVELGKIPDQPGFSNIVIFEQQSKIGGIWNSQLELPDPGLPPSEFFASGDYFNADKIHPKKTIPGLQSASKDKPFETEAYEDRLQWSKSAVYDGLFSNVPKRFLRFSSIPYKQEEKDKESLTYPFISYKQIGDNLVKFAEDHDLNKLIRLSTEIEAVGKTKDGKWQVTARKHNPDSKKDQWYQETFDAVIVASGHYSVPFVPYFPGLAEYTAKYPDRIIHNKAWRNPEPYRGKNVLFVGGSLSSLDIVQYIYPVANKTYISRRKREQVFPWLQTAAESEGIVNKPNIAAFHADTDEIEFVDGSKVQGIDRVILATGYHWHYNFLPTGKYYDYGDVVHHPGSRISGLYQEIFSIEDPTLAFVGVKITTLKWPTIEAEAAAVAGVWSNAAKLPAKSDQIEWEKHQVALRGNGVAFHYAPYLRVKEDYIDKILELAPSGRPHPLRDSYEHIDEVTTAMGTLEDLFFKLKDGKITYQQTL